jgi:hypothetical protein
MLYSIHDVGGYLIDTKPSYNALHYFGLPKPWRGIMPEHPADRLLPDLPGLSSIEGDPKGRVTRTVLEIMSRTYRYLASTTLRACHPAWLEHDPAPEDGLGTCSRCFAYLWLLRRGIERDERFPMLDLTSLQRRGYGAEDTDTWAG